jgi:acetylglutamate kinase
MDASKTILPLLTVSDCQKLIADGIATGGMQAKLEAAMKAVSNGVAEVRIVRGSDHHIVARVFNGENVGTRVIVGQDARREIQ